ncbi:MAG: hypothetical protein WCD79_00930 [Chthoniobacteraceae bacterium]
MKKNTLLPSGSMQLHPARLATLSCAVLLATCLATASATTYYLSPSGSDTNSGTSSSAPWKTAAKVNGATFNGGDTLLLQGGQSFTGSFIFTRGKVLSGTSSHFTVGTYGTGNPTIISTGTGTNSYAILVQGVSGVVLQDLIVRAGAVSPQAGIYIHNDSGGNPPPQDITVQRCDIGGFHFAPANFGGEIFANGYWGSLTNINILNNVLHGLTGPSSPDDNGFTSLGNGKNIASLTVQGNTVYDIGGTANSLGGSIANGILADGVNGGLLQYNIVHDCGGNTTTCGGPGGIWTYNSNNVTIQFNEVYQMKPLNFTGGCDWAAYDLDGKTTNCVVQYNYSHDNFGPGLLAYVDGTWGPNTLRYNISENDDSGNSDGGPISIGGTTVSGTIQIYNNTIYDGSTQTTTNGHSPVYGPYNSGTWGAGSMIKNNIFYVTNKNKYGQVSVIYFPYQPQTNLTLDNNVYYVTAASPIWRWGGTNYTTFAAYQTATGFDAHSLTTDPKLLAPGTSGTLSWTPSLANGPQPGPAGYVLQNSSPLFGIGANPGSTSPGTRDYFGYVSPNGTGSGYNIGADGGLPDNIPVAPSNLTATWATMLNGWFKLAWTDNSNNETGFTIQTLSGTTWNTYTTVAANTVTYTRTGLSMPSGPYTLRVIATGTAGNSTPSNQVTFSLPTPPSMPNTLVATPGTAQVILSWTAVTGASDYNIQRATNSAGPYTTIKYNNSPVTYTDSSVTSGTAYYYNVSYNVSGAGASLPCSAVSCTPN